MRLFRTRKGSLLESKGNYYLIDQLWDDLINRNELFAYLEKAAATGKAQPADQAAAWITKELLPPIGSQEVWAAGVTYLRSRNARMEESKTSGGATFYDKVYEAERPELFFKSLAHRVATHGEMVYIRRDAQWNVPEPELTLFMNAKGQIQAYTIGNDMSSRDIEGENPLYLPQAKVYERSAALGPCLFIPKEPIPSDTVIRMTISRDGKEAYKGEVPISQIKRGLPELAGWLFKEMDFVHGCFLMTGTCLVPPNEFTLQEKDKVDISIDHIGAMTNYISYKPLSLPPCRK